MKLYRVAHTLVVNVHADSEEQAVLNAGAVVRQLDPSADVEAGTGFQPLGLEAVWIKAKPDSCSVLP